MLLDSLLASPQHYLDRIAGCARGVFEYYSGIALRGRVEPGVALRMVLMGPEVGPVTIKMVLARGGTGGDQDGMR